MYDYVAENYQLEEGVPARSEQPMLFDFMEPEPEPDIDPDYLGRACKRCGTCASMDTSLPGCTPGEFGRCIDPTARSYFLKPEHTRANDWLPDGDPEKYPKGGSWHYVDRDSCACDKHRSRGRISA